MTAVVVTNPGAWIAAVLAVGLLGFMAGAAAYGWWTR